MAITVRISGTQKKTLPSVRIAGVWRTAGQVHTRVAGVWRPAWSYTWATGTWGTCSLTCGGGTQFRSVTCQRNDGVTMPDAVCTALVGAKPATSQTCNTQSCSTCAYSAAAPYYMVLAAERETIGDQDYTHNYTYFMWGVYSAGAGIKLSGNTATSVNSGGCTYTRSTAKGYRTVNSYYGYAYQICRCCPNC